MSVEFRFLELEHYDNEPHFRRFARVREARQRECTVLLPQDVRPQRLFDAFLQQVVTRLESPAYLPVARFCDGEYSFYVGRDTTTCWGENSSSIRREGVEALHTDALRTIWENGFLCPNLNLAYLGIQADFLQFLAEHGTPLRNYVPFYFVYALLVHPRFLAALRGRSVALVSHFGNKNVSNILSVLRRAEVSDVELCEIPPSGVAHGRFSLQLTRRPALALVGAGIGAPLVLARLHEQQCVAIDAGFVFHLWDGTFDRHARLFLNYAA